VVTPRPSPLYSPGVEIELLGFDADDTLWHNMPIFRSAEARIAELLSRYHDPEWITRRLDETQIRNLEHFGYGIKGFTLSMIETAIELSEGRITGEEIRQILETAREMLQAPVELMDGVSEAIRRLSEDYELILITKGDLFDQEGKLARSGLGEYFDHVQVVSRKDSETYETILSRFGIARDRFAMVGDSLRSDILPVVEIGSTAVHIPPERQWDHEIVSLEGIDRTRWVQLDSIAELPEWLERNG
jgi:putative hydrolase of the HAD superfamily